MFWLHGLVDSSIQNEFNLLFPYYLCRQSGDRLQTPESDVYRRQILTSDSDSENIYNALRPTSKYSNEAERAD